MKIRCSGNCNGETEFKNGEWKITKPWGPLYSYKKAILEITPGCQFALLTRKQVIELRDFLSDVIAQTYVEHYFYDPEEE